MDALIFEVWTKKYGLSRMRATVGRSLPRYPRFWPEVPLFEDYLSTHDTNKDIVHDAGKKHAYNFDSAPVA